MGTGLSRQARQKPKCGRGLALLRRVTRALKFWRRTKRDQFEHSKCGETRSVPVYLVKVGPALYRESEDLKPVCRIDLGAHCRCTKLLRHSRHTVAAQSQHSLCTAFALPCELPGSVLLRQHAPAVALPGQAGQVPACRRVVGPCAHEQGNHNIWLGVGAGTAHAHSVCAATHACLGAVQVSRL